MIESGEIGICGAMYNVESGVVYFYEDACIIRENKTEKAGSLIPV
jgi:hypothetical protein